LASPSTSSAVGARAARCEVLQAELRTGLVADGVSACGLDGPRGGKMFGVLVVEDSGRAVGFLRAFSGMLDGCFDVPGYVPPIFDRDARAAVEPSGEAVVKRLLARAASSRRPTRCSASAARSRPDARHVSESRRCASASVRRAERRLVPAPRGAGTIRA
jgi:tRNA pseudouridine32 synthase/23S rRNA pseudouridine746 synthase